MFTVFINLSANECVRDIRSICGVCDAVNSRHFVIPINQYLYWAPESRSVIETGWASSEFVTISTPILNGLQNIHLFLAWEILSALMSIFRIHTFWTWFPHGKERWSRRDLSDRAETTASSNSLAFFTDLLAWTAVISGRTDPTWPLQLMLVSWEYYEINQSISFIWDTHWFQGWLWAPLADREKYESRIRGR